MDPDGDRQFAAVATCLVRINSGTCHAGWRLRRDGIHGHAAGGHHAGSRIDRRIGIVLVVCDRNGTGNREFLRGSRFRVENRLPVLGHQQLRKQRHAAQNRPEPADHTLGALLERAGRRSSQKFRHGPAADEGFSRSPIFDGVDRGVDVDVPGLVRGAADRHRASERR